MDANINAYMLRHPELSKQRPLAVQYTNHRRDAFSILAENYRLDFRLETPEIGLRAIDHPTGLGSSLLDGRRPSVSVLLTSPRGTPYDTSRAKTPARINIFRHGPHYYDVHIFDLVPTSPSGDPLPVRGELVWHAYPDRLFLEVRLHVVEAVELAAAEVLWHLDGDRVHRRSAGVGIDAAEVVRMAASKDLCAGAWIGVAAAEGPALGWILATATGTEALSLDPDALTVTQRFSAGSGRWEAGAIRSLGCRVAMHPGGDPTVFGFMAAVETTPLGPNRFRVGAGGRFEGYDAHRGHYTIVPTASRTFVRGETFHFYDHPDDHDILPLIIENDAYPRTIYVKHLDTRLGRIEAGIVTDEAGMALPVLVQGSKNFCGEDEEPFYHPGDAAYAESYFPLVLAAGERLRLRSYHARQNWGTHPLKQVSSLQAWVPYYQMSLGVTETTCYVPFRFGGHRGIWIADLRGVSGKMWATQPQFDNVGGHRFFHYRDTYGEHFLRYLRTRFQLTSPNMCRWGMDYTTEAGEATAALDIWEFPQTDQTRSFVRLRIDFQHALAVPRPVTHLFLLSLDTSVQRLRYATLGYWDASGRLTECPARADSALPAGASLGRDAPFVALYGCMPESVAHGNNAIVVRDFDGRYQGRPLSRLAVTAVPWQEDHLLVGLTLDLPEKEARFQPGDFLQLDAMIVPYGTVGDGPAAPLAERIRFGTAGPTASATRGEILETFPLRVRVDSEERAAITLKGGYSTLAVLIEGFRDYAPPILERCQPSGWQPVNLTGDGPEGHHTYLTADRHYGFVFLVTTEGGDLSLRVRRAMRD